MAWNLIWTSRILGGKSQWDEPPGTAFLWDECGSATHGWNLGRGWQPPTGWMSLPRVTGQPPSIGSSWKAPTVSFVFTFWDQTAMDFISIISHATYQSITDSAAESIEAREFRCYRMSSRTAVSTADSFCWFRTTRRVKLPGSWVVVTGSSNALLMWNTLLMMLAPSEAKERPEDNTPKSNENKMCSIMFCFASGFLSQAILCTLYLHIVFVLLNKWNTARPASSGTGDLVERISSMRSSKMASSSIMKRQLSDDW